MCPSPLSNCFPRPWCLLKKWWYDDDEISSSRRMYMTGCVMPARRDHASSDYNHGTLQHCSGNCCFTSHTDTYDWHYVLSTFSIMYVFVLLLVLYLRSVSCLINDMLCYVSLHINHLKRRTLQSLHRSQPIQDSQNTMPSSKLTHSDRPVLGQNIVGWPLSFLLPPVPLRSRPH